MPVRAKFKVSSIEQVAWGNSDKGTVSQWNYTLDPVTRTSDDPDSENTRFWTATPVGKIEMSTVNPLVADTLVIGGEVYVDFTPVE